MGAVSRSTQPVCAGSGVAPALLHLYHGQAERRCHQSVCLSGLDTVMRCSGSTLDLIWNHLKMLSIRAASLCTGFTAARFRVTGPSRPLLEHKLHHTVIPDSRLQN